MFRVNSFFALVAAFGATNIFSAAHAASIVVNAKGSSAAGVAAHFRVFANGAVIGQTVARSTYSDFTFSTSIAVSEIRTVMVQFDNDALINGEDRNLYVNSISVDGRKTLSTANNVKYDRGTLGGTNIQAGQVTMPWNGYLIYSFSPVASPSPSPTPTTIPVPSPSPSLPLKDSGPISIGGKTNVVISGLRIKNPNGNCISVSGSTNVTIENSEIGPCLGEGVYILNSKSVTVRQNSISEVRTGVYAVQSQQIDVSHNEFLNMNGPFPRGQFTQFNQVTGTGNRINFNYGVNILGQSYPEDAINLYKSQGTAEDPIQVHSNYIRGGGPSASGGGIMLGDNGGAHVSAVGNVLIDPGQYGIAIASGEKIAIKSNKIYGAKQSFTNVGLYVWNQYPTPCRDHVVSGNEVFWVRSTGTANPYWNSGNCANVQWTGNVSQSSNVNANMPAPVGAGITNR